MRQKIFQSWYTKGYSDLNEDSTSICYHLCHVVKFLFTALHILLKFDALTIDIRYNYNRLLSIEMYTSSTPKASVSATRTPWQFSIFFIPCFSVVSTQEKTESERNVKCPTYGKSISFVDFNVFMREKIDFIWNENSCHSRSRRVVGNSRKDTFHIQEYDVIRRI